MKTDYSKSIQVRTKDVIHRFNKYVNGLQESVFETFGITKASASQIVEETGKQLDDLLNSYLNGNIIAAINIAYHLLFKIKLSSIKSNTNFYRARDNNTGFLYTKEEMFHIPYELRHKVTNQRYSVSGLPCLYLGSSTYLCWEELERPDYLKCNFCLLRNYGPLWVFDLRIPPELSSIEDIYRVCLALASSLKSQKEH